jgi:hypothetical protein
MAVTVIQNSCVAGALAGLMAQRYVGSVTPTDYTAVANAARAIADEFITVNAASGAAIADADNAQVGPLVQSCATAAIIGSGATSVTATDYLTYGRQIYASAKQGLTKLI